MAYSLQPKKMLALNLLELLRKYSDENHRLSQQELAAAPRIRIRDDSRPQVGPAQPA